MQFVIKRDEDNAFSFASLQSDSGKEILSQYGEKYRQLKTVVLIENNKLYSKSSAALRILKNLKSGWKLLFVFIIIPKPLRDLVYDFIAKYRYRWFGKTDECMMPTRELQAKFL